MSEVFHAHSPDSQPEDAEAREIRHQSLAELLGAYADGELPVETSSHIDAHLLGCARCRNELSVQRAIGRRLAANTIPTATPEFQNRIRSAITAQPMAPLPVSPPVVAPVRRPSWLSWIPLVVAACVLIGFSGRQWVNSRVPQLTPPPLVVQESVPAITAIFEEYRRMTAGDLPGRARDLEAVRLALPFDIVPLDNSDVHLLAAWTTELDGEPAAVLAYRWQASVVLQFVVTESLLFRMRDIRLAFASGRSVVSTSESQSLLAWPEARAGSVLVGEGSWSRLVELTKARVR